MCARRSRHVCRQLNAFKTIYSETLEERHSLLFRQDGVFSQIMDRFEIQEDAQLGRIVRAVVIEICCRS